MNELEKDIEVVLSSPFVSYRSFGPNEKAESIAIIIGLVYPLKIVMTPVIAEEDWLLSTDTYEHDSEAERQSVRLGESATLRLKVALLRGQDAPVEAFEMPNF